MHSGLLVRHARLSGGTSADRERLTAALDRLSLAEIGLPPRATLLLGRVVAPAPLGMRSLGSELFVRRLQETLRTRAAHARRTPGGPAEADRLFEDDAALETALVAVWLSRRAEAPALLRAITGSDTPDLRLRWRRTILTDAARSGPAIVRLAGAGLAERWLAGFAQSELCVAAKRIHTHHGAAATLREPIAMAAPAPGAPPVAVPATVSDLVRTLTALAPEVRRDVMAEVRTLILGAVVAARRPALLVLAEFTQAAELALCGPAAPERRTAPVSAQAMDGQEIEAVRSETDEVDPPLAANDAPPAPWFAAGDEGEAVTALPVARDRTETRYGGLAFLLNAFVALELWGDFSRPDDGLKGLSPFELLLMLGRHWYGQAFAADPLHAVLRDLSGLRRGEAPGTHFAVPRWSVPDAWLAPWPGGRVSAKGRHEAGFVLGDPGFDGRPVARRRSHWLAALACYLSARLAAALGETDGRAARDRVCLRPATAFTDGDRLVLRFGLVDHPLEIRMAGLDRDPGRLAGASRPVCFEFTA